MHAWQIQNHIYHLVSRPNHPQLKHEMSKTTITTLSNKRLTNNLKREGQVLEEFALILSL